jgi:hypothetical protein
MELADRIGLLFELIAHARRREVDDAVRASPEAIQDCRRGVGRKEGPHQEHRLDPVQERVQGVRDGQVSAHDVDAARQAGGVGVAGQRTDGSARAQQLGHDLTADVAGRPGHQDHVLPGVRAPVVSFHRLSLRVKFRT